jgi:hypothetical protein
LNTEPKSPTEGQPTPALAVAHFPDMAEATEPQVSEETRLADAWEQHLAVTK